MKLKEACALVEEEFRKIAAGVGEHPMDVRFEYRYVDKDFKKCVPDGVTILFSDESGWGEGDLYTLIQHFKKKGYR